MTKGMLIKIAKYQLSPRRNNLKYNHPSYLSDYTTKMKKIFNSILVTLHNFLL